MVARYKIILAIVALLLVLLVAAAQLLDWNLLRGAVARRIAEQTGRNFSINGDLTVRLLSLHPRVVANGLVLGNAAWGSDPVMAQAARAELEVELWSLLRGRPVFSRIALSNPGLLLEKNRDGMPNWQFHKQGKPSALPQIELLDIDHGSLRYRDPQLDLDLRVEVDTGTPGATGATGARMMQVSAEGRYKGLPVRVSGTAGGLLNLADADRPYPIKLSGMVGKTRAVADGLLLNPRALKGEDIQFRLEGADMAELYPVAGVPLPATPSYSLAGRLNHQGEVWKFSRFKGKVGDSDLEGDFSLDLGRKPQFISAELRSDNLDLKDMGGLIGGSRGERSPPLQRPDRVLPAERFDLTKLHAANANVRFSGQRVVTEKLPIERMSTHLVLRDGVLQLDPLDFGVAGGDVVSAITLDARKPEILTQADIRLRRLRLEKLFPSSGLADNKKVNVGTLGGRAKLTGHGNSLAELLGSANGDAALIVDGGSISELLLRLSNLDLANALPVLLTGDKQVPLRCLVGQFHAEDGDFGIESLVVDTPKVHIGGSGDVNFKNEALNVRLVGQSKEFSLASLRGPINITGNFKNPAARPEGRQVLGRGALAALLGAGTAGLGALIPLVELGQQPDNPSHCAELVDNAKQSADVKSKDVGAASPPR